VVIKPQGLYRDRDLYNYVVGPQYPGANWTRKERPLDVGYRAEDLEKLRLSVPCYVTALPGVRRRVRDQLGAARRGQRRSVSGLRNAVVRSADTTLRYGLGSGGQTGRGFDVHCVVGLSHVQRLECLALLGGRSGVRGIVGTQGAAPLLVSGTEYGGQELPQALARELASAADPFRRQQTSRAGFLVEMRRHRMAVAPTGYGELTFRHGEALMAGVTLVCQDLSHVEMLMPLRDRETAVFCRPDLGDLRDVVDELLSDPASCAKVATAGHRAFTRWAWDWRRLLRDGFESHIFEVAGRA
jgi:hypothetical protein